MTILDFNSARRQGEISRQGVDLDDIRNRLHDSPKAFIDWLYGGRAYFTRTDARIGNIEGEAGSSLSIDLRTGLWKDHATDDGGDLIALYRAWRGYAGDSHFATSLKEIARDYLGDPVEVEAVAWTPSARDRIQQQKAKLGTKPRDENEKLGAPVGKWKYYDLHGKIIAAVERYEPDGTPASKQYRPYCFKTVDGVEKWVMGAPNIRPLLYLSEVATSAIVVLVEGEKCAEALRSIGVVATTAMQGAKAPVDKTDWTPLAGKRVIIWPDNDEPGMDYARKAAEKLQSLGCTVLGVTPPADKPAKWDAADCIAEGGNAHGLIDDAAPVSGSKPRGKITVLSISEMRNMRPPEWLIDGIITKNGLSMLWGPSGAMKSFLGVDIALPIATGLAWHGRAVQQGLVFYVAAEGSHGLAKRVLGWCAERGKGLPEDNFLLIPQPVALAQEIDDLIAVILSYERMPALIIIDTVARTFGAGNENQQQDMNAYVQALDRLRIATGAHVMVIHHSGVGDAARERGSNVLRGAADTIIKVERKGKGKNVTLINQGDGGKQKDFEEFPNVYLETVPAAYIAIDGTEVSTIVLNERSAEDVAAEKERSNGGAEASSEGELKGNAKTIYDCLKAFGLGMDRAELMARSGISRNSFTGAIKGLLKRGLIDERFDITTNQKIWSAVQ